MPRGSILDRDGEVLARNEKDANGELYRVYRGESISQVVGYASSRYGRAGLELAYDAELSGLAGDPVSDALRKFGTDPYDPKDLTLSLSLELQRAAVRALGDRKGAVVMLDPRNGEVLAMASTPTYSASALADPATADRTFKALQEDEDEPLLPRATLGRYVPGSVFKIVTAIAGLGSGAVTPRTTYAEQPGAEEDGLRGRAGSGSATAITSSRAPSGWTSSARPRSPATSGTPSRAWRPVAATSSTTPSAWASGRRCPSTCRPRSRRSRMGAATTRVASSTTSSWPTPPTARARRS